MEQQTTSKCDKYAANSGLNKHHILGTSLYLHIFPAIPISVKKKNTKNKNKQSKTKTCKKLLNKKMVKQIKVKQQQKHRNVNTKAKLESIIK